MSDSTPTQVRLAGDFDDSIAWDRPAAEVAAWIAGRSAERPAFAFLDGFRVTVTEALAVEDEVDGAVGEIVRLDGNRPLVKTGAGALSLIRYSMHVAGDHCTDLGAFLAVCPIEPPLVLSRLPFLDSTRSNLWELRVDRWRNRGQTISEARPEVAERVQHALLEANRPFFEHLMARLGLAPEARAIDVGCGEGWAARGFFELGLEVAGFDLLPSSVAVARGLTPAGTFFECNVYDLSKRDDLKGRFDLVFCRDMGLAQKIVDWNEPSWVEVGRAILDLLKPDGVLYWIQMTDCSGRLTVDGFSNATLDTLRQWFGRHGELVQVTSCGYVSLVACRREVAASWRSRLHTWDATTVRSVVEARASELARAESPAASPARAVTRALYLLMSPFLLLPDARRERGIVIAGTGRLAQLCAEVADDVRLRVLAFSGAGSGRGIFMGRLVLPLAEALALDPAGLLLTEAGQARPASRIPCVSVYEGQAGPPRPVFLVSGDQDAYFEGVKAAAAAQHAWATPLLGAADVLRNGSFETWDGAAIAPQEWTFGPRDQQEPEQGRWARLLGFGRKRRGGAKTTAAPISSDLRPGTRAVSLTFRQGTTYLLQRQDLGQAHTVACFGCWIWADVPNVARVQLSNAEGDVASVCHPGDGQWHFLVVRKPLEAAGYLDSYVQLIGPGQARFDEATLLIQ